MGAVMPVSVCDLSVVTWLRAFLRQEQDDLGGCPASQTMCLQELSVFR